MSREDQDKLACDSQRKAAEAVQAGNFSDEIVPVTVPGRKPGQETVVDRDLYPKPDTTMEVLAKLRPAFIVRTRRNTCNGNVLFHDSFPPCSPAAAA